MSKKLEVLPGFVFIKPFEPLKVTASGVIIPDIALEKSSEGNIVAMHPKSKLDVETGDGVLFSINAATVFNVGDEKLVIIREASVFGKLK